MSTSMTKYPYVLFFRYDKYKTIDYIFDESDKFECAIEIINSADHLNKLYDTNYPILVTYGETVDEYYKDVYGIIADRMNKRWIHYKDTISITNFVFDVNYSYIQTVLTDRPSTRPTFSIFTTCYNSYDKINRVYKSIIAQKYRDWEWIILDDSPDDMHFSFLKEKFSMDRKVRLYKRSSNSGNIGNVKNEAVSLCRGKYILEMDHDDEIIEDVLSDATKIFEADKEVGFIYMDFININENGSNYWYGDFTSKGYAGYYRQKYMGKWVEVYMSPNINNITLSHIVCLPNHPRIWKTEILLKLGNYSEFLPICDDQEILMKTALNTKIVKIPKLGYIQYMNDNNNNFSLIRNHEINRLGTHFIVPQFYKMYNVHNKMKSLGAYEDEKYITENSQIWKRKNYKHVYCNLRILDEYDTQFCIIGLDTFSKYFDLLKEAYNNPRNDFLLLDSNTNKDTLCAFLDSNNFSRMKCYSIPNTPNSELCNYFNFLYKSCDDTIIFKQDT
jgi:glycosyltransferase involved in cell wall biosynthesis